MDIVIISVQFRMPAVVAELFANTVPDITLFFRNIATLPCVPGLIPETESQTELSILDSFGVLIVVRSAEGPTVASLDYGCKKAPFALNGACAVWR